MRARLFPFAIFPLAFAALVQPLPAGEGFRMQDLLPRSLQPNPKLDFSVLTEVTPEGKKAAQPSTESPLYYIGSDGGRMDGGDPIAGERAPKKELLARTMQEALKSSGYRAASKEHPPTLYVHFRWGSYNGLTTSLAGLSTDSSGGTLDEFQRANLIERCAIVGGTRFAIEAARHLRSSGTLAYFRALNDTNEDLVARAESDLYFVIASAYDFAAAQRGERVLLWRTRMSTTSQGLTMDMALPAIVRLAGPYFGKEMEVPAVITPRLYEGRAVVGEPRVIEAPRR